LDSFIDLIVHRDRDRIKICWVGLKIHRDRQREFFYYVFYYEVVLFLVIYTCLKHCEKVPTFQCHGDNYGVIWYT
jgi:hypothetical protein